MGGRLGTQSFSSRSALQVSCVQRLLGQGKLHQDNLYFNAFR
jgi:hypothetical protein